MTQYMSIRSKTDEEICEVWTEGPIPREGDLIELKGMGVRIVSDIIWKEGTGLTSNFIRPFIYVR